VYSINEKSEDLLQLLHDLNSGKTSSNDLLTASEDFPEYSSLALAIYFSRPDLMKTFPLHEKDSPQRLRSWFLNYGIREYRLDFLQNDNQDFFEKEFDVKKPMLNLIGLYKNVGGVGHNIRVFKQLLDSFNVQHNLYNIALNRIADLQHIDLRNSHPLEFLDTTSIFFFNGDIFESALNRFTYNFNNRKNNIAYWAWELEARPPWIESEKYFDEIWAISEFTTRSLSEFLNKDAITIPIPFFEDSLTLTANLFNARFPLLKDNNYFLTIFDYNSCFYRKNPLLTVKIFKKAFEHHPNPPFLYIKSLNGKSHKVEQELLLKEIGKSDYIIIDNSIHSNLEISSLLQNAAGVLSMHSAEGFGITLRDALAYGTPVLATGYSGNVEYMDLPGSISVSYSLNPPPFGSSEIYNVSGALWANPDIDDAVDKLKFLNSNLSEIKKQAIASSCEIRERYSPKKMMNRISSRL
jgi:glycosyltransferase involved in cell wall biosynthesis